MTDFDTPIDRRGTGSLKWDCAEGELPMWVADMDFSTAPAVREAIAARAAHGVFGYSVVPQAWNDAYCTWWQTRHGLTIDPDSLIFCTGVVPAISSLVRKLTTPAENVLLMTPVYPIFFNCAQNNGRRIIESPLRFDGGDYHIDFADLEQKLADPQTAMMILCNPHNPIGRIWDRDTLARIGALCRKHHVLVVSDEIHCDLTAPGRDYVPFAAVSEECRLQSITCLAPTKTFNIAGLQTAAVCVPDPVLRHKVWRGLNTDEVAEPNAFAVDAAVAAFTKGAPWLDELRGYIAQNKREAADFIRAQIPSLCPVPSEATYLLWLYADSFCGRADEAAALIRRTTGLWLSAGTAYGGNGGSCLRMNLACPRQVMTDGLNRLKAGMAACTAHFAASPASSR